MLPKDPEMLYSYVNLKLRDNYSSLDDMCDDLDVSKTEIEEILGNAGYVYNAQANKFTSR